MKGFPGNWINLTQVVIVLSFLSVILAMIWEGTLKIIQTPVGLEQGDVEEQRRRLTATYKVMTSYTPKDDTAREYSEFPDGDEEH
jgi:hypothetical protein